MRGIDPVLPTADEAKKIKAGDREMINRYYMANYDFVMLVCKSYCRKDGLSNGLYEDMAQECYLYFGKFDFSSVPAFIRGIRDVCVYVRWGGERVYHQVRQGHTEILTVLDEPATKDAKHSDEGMTVGDTIPAECDLLDEIEPPPDYAEIVHDIALNYMTPQQRKAFEYFYYSDMTAREVGLEMGLTLYGAQSLKTGYIYRLRKCAEQFREALILAGVQSALIGGTSGAGYQRVGGVHVY